MWWLTALAVLVAAASLVWAVVTWRLAHASRVELTIEPTIRFIGGGDFECYSIVARNHSHHSVRLEWPWLEVHSESPPARINIMSFHPECGIPGEIPAKAKALCWVPREDAEAMELIDVPVVAAVPSAEGKVYRSPATTIPASAWDMNPALHLRPA